MFCHGGVELLYFAQTGECIAFRRRVFGFVLFVMVVAGVLLVWSCCDEACDWTAAS